MKKPRLNISGSFNLKVAVLLAISAALSAPAGFAESGGVPPAISEIVRKVEGATVPAKDYTAMVHQTVTRPSGTAAASAAGIQAELVAEEDYQVNCSVSGETHAGKRLSSRMGTAAKATASTTPGGKKVMRGGLLTINPLRALRKIAETPSAQVGEEVCQNAPCYKLSAKDGGYGFVVWVNKANSSVSRVLLSQEDTALEPTILFDTTFAYTNWNGLLAPSHVEITTPSNGTKMIHDYTGHAF